ncbi:hypothetical protein Lfu02_61250 [Longispora fulva]|uniref:Tetratricopeptide (TPR) repeat protein n=1 Tax=Longispora fulva TaxID=619741 RepID=A0A8J7KMX8_9ACTN|nr:DUF5107 domain-containing protein [Longispora fulva]MBG6134547.1 tetratricopeptide (TPR) repeat protein [Longispora fulva]GIG61753.1 hypothetical protein Lfu02_61250 [Longispora fulva]
MTHVRLDTVRLPVAPLGDANPLPPLGSPRPVTSLLDASAADPELAANLAYGHPATLLPYTTQDGYTRDLADTDVPVAVVDNGIVRAEFLLGYGGRMRSLVHLPTGQELLHRNPVLQPANLALRNAWFAGGVEWNLGTTGHSPLTCAPLHAARVTRPDGVQVLRMWEFERLRELVYQIDAYAPPLSEVLYVHVRIINPNPHEVPVYWWSNIAVPETPGTRVVAPADSAYHLSYDGRLRRVPVPVRNGSDASYPAAAPNPADYFYDIVPRRRRWIAAVDADGTGLFHTSTDWLRGRKLFVWGHSPGGRRWQEWLSPPGHPYLEIQAGLARTQLEHLPMPAGERWSWLEAYGRLDVDKVPAHDPSWITTRGAVERALQRQLPRDAVDREYANASAWVDLPPTQRLHTGSGWGALERHCRADTSLHLPGTPFDDDTLGPEQQPWRALVDTGALPAPPPGTAPTSYQVAPGWRALLERAPENWFSLLHVGVARWHAGNTDGARAAWRASVHAARNPWALRNLAVANLRAGQFATAADQFTSALRLRPGLRPLVVEALGAMLAADRPEQALAVVDGLGPALRAHGRIRHLECAAAIAADRMDRAGRLLGTGIVIDDLKEGDDALEQLWFAYHERLATTVAVDRVRADNPLPTIYDFRMSPP